MVLYPPPLSPKHSIPLACALSLRHSLPLTPSPLSMYRISAADCDINIAYLPPPVPAPPVTRPALSHRPGGRYVLTSPRLAPRVPLPSCLLRAGLTGRRVQTQTPG